MTAASQLHLGIDPGLNGAWALLDAAGRLVDADHFPIGDDGEIDAAELHQVWGELGVTRATIEKVGSMGGSKNGRRQGVQGMFNFGRRYGTALSVLQVLGIAYDQVEPRIWKGATGVTAEKESSLRAARQLWPSATATLLKRVKDEARAEAALIARYGRNVGFSHVRKP